MMSYIRTKDGRIIDLKGWSIVKSISFVNLEKGEVTKDTCYERTWFEQHGDLVEYKTERISRKGEVLKEADTIEELCDEFVLDHPLFGDSCKCLYHSFEKAKNGIKKRSDKAHNLCGDFTIYGAIWIEKGLIYVTKMNDKGELELL